MVDERIKKRGSVHVTEYYPAFKKEEILPFVATQVDLEGMMPSETSQAKREEYYMILLICGI